MNKKKLAKSVVGIALIVSVAILIVVCVGKIKHIQNKKNIIGTWKNANAEEVFTFQENGGLVVNKDMPELGITCGNALYSISSSNMIFGYTGAVKPPVRMTGNRESGHKETGMCAAEPPSRRRCSSGWAPVNGLLLLFA